MSRKRDAERYALRRAQHRCAMCGERLPTNYTKGTCQSCLEYKRITYIAKTNPRKYRALENQPLEARRDRTPGCAVCGLRGEHECLQGNAQDRRPWL